MEDSKSAILVKMKDSIVMEDSTCNKANQNWEFFLKEIVRRTASKIVHQNNVLFVSKFIAYHSSFSCTQSFHQGLDCSFLMYSGVSVALVSLGMYMSTISNVEFSSLIQLRLRWK